MIRDRQREAIKSFAQSWPMTVEGMPNKDGIRISWTIAGITHSVEGRGLSPDELMCKIPRIEQHYLRAEAEDRRNAGPDTT